MKTMINIFLFLTSNLYAIHAQNEKIGILFNNAPMATDYSSTISLSISDNVTEQAVREWVSANRAFFYNTDSIHITSTSMWRYGSTHEMITQITFIKSENGAKRKAYFEEIRRKKEEERLAEENRKEELARQRDAQIRAENERLAKVKSDIENGTFTGTHYYTYPQGKYEGQFVNGKPDGNGVQHLGSECYHGKFVKGVFHGQGTYKESTGVQYTGEFVNGQRHGKFIARKLNFFESHQWEAKYNYGELVYEDIPNSSPVPATMTINTQTNITASINQE